MQKTHQFAAEKEAAEFVEESFRDILKGVPAKVLSVGGISHPSHVPRDLFVRVCARSYECARVFVCSCAHAHACVDLFWVSTSYRPALSVCLWEGFDGTWSRVTQWGRVFV